MKVQLENGTILDLPDREAQRLLRIGKARVAPKFMGYPAKDKMMRIPVICK